MARLVHRQTTVSSSASSSWQDVTVGMSGMAAQLATDSRKVRMDLTGSDWGTQVDTINGASVTRVVGGAFDGTDCVRIVPPSGSTPNSNQTYSAIMRGLDLSNGGTHAVAQVNLGFCVAYGSRYWDLAHTAKVTGVLGSQTIGGVTSAQARAAIFENFKDLGASDLRRVFCVTAMTTQAYKEPDNWIDQGPETDFLFVLGNTSNHSNDPPLVATEVLYFEQEVDYQRGRGNANGRNRLDVWARDGYLGFLDIPLTWEATWNFAYQYAREIEYIGALWNSPATANANNYLDVSHPIVSVNRAKDDRIGPPPGFLL
jgi:hypothetical protein